MTDLVSGEGNASSAWGLPIRDVDTFKNLTDSQFLVRVLGPKHMGYGVVIPMTMVYVLLFLTGVLGNLAVCLVIVRNRSMHTATNYYLFSLAMADLVILILGLPNELALYWQQYPWALGETTCRARSLISEMTGYASVLTILAFSMERYLAICHPLYQYAMAGFSRAVKIIFLVWLVSFLSALPYAFFTKLNYIHRPLDSKRPEDILDDSAFCALLDENIYPKDYPLHQLSSFLFFLLPLGLLVILYVRMGLRIHEPSRNGRLRASVHGHDPLRSSRRSILRMLAAVVVAFFICWAPFHTQRLGYVYFKHTKIYRTVNEYLFHVSGFFYYFSATINPILYNVMSLKYRHAFRATLCGKSGSSDQSSLVRTYTWRSSITTTRPPAPSSSPSPGLVGQQTSIKMAVVNRETGQDFHTCHEYKDIPMHAGQRPNTVCFVIQEEAEESSSGEPGAASTSFIQTIQCDVTLKVNQTIKVVHNNPKLVESKNVTGDAEALDEEDDEDDEAAMAAGVEKVEDQDSGTESVTDLAAGLLWQAKITIPEISKQITDKNNSCGVTET